jgi:hypothetical protein
LVSKKVLGRRSMWVSSELCRLMAAGKGGGGGSVRGWLGGKGAGGDDARSDPTQGCGRQRAAC